MGRWWPERVRVGSGMYVRVYECRLGMYVVRWRGKVREMWGRCIPLSIFAVLLGRRGTVFDQKVRDSIVVRVF